MVGWTIKSGVAHLDLHGDGNEVNELDLYTWLLTFHNRLPKYDFREDG